MSNELVKFVDLVPMSTTAILQRKAEISKIGKEVMKKADFEKGIPGHFGVIPGTKTSCLLKAGAQLLCMMFGIAPKYETEKFDIECGHREYESVCNGYQIGTDVFLGQGVGSCSTLESKYRYRYERGEGEDTGKALPGKYWGEKKKKTEEGTKAAIALIGGPGFFPKKLDDGRWMIFKKTETNKIPNPDIADQYNTVKKQSNKRALVDMVLQVLAAGDMFTQDQYEKIIDKIKSGDDIDVPWSEVEPQSEKKETSNFDPKSFSQSQTSPPEEPSQKPPTKEKTDEQKPEKPKEKKERPPRAKKQEPVGKGVESTKTTKGSEKESTIRARVIDWMKNNESLYEELEKKLIIVFPGYKNITGLFNLEYLPVKDWITDGEIKIIDNTIREAGLYK